MVSTMLSNNLSKDPNKRASNKRVFEMSQQRRVRVRGGKMLVRASFASARYVRKCEFQNRTFRNLST